MEALVAAAAHYRYAIAAALRADPDDLIDFAEAAVRALGAEKAVALLARLALAVRTRAGATGAAALLSRGGGAADLSRLACARTDAAFLAELAGIEEEAAAAVLDPWHGQQDALTRTAAQLVPGRARCARCGSEAVQSDVRRRGLRGDEGDTVAFKCVSPAFYPPGCGHHW